MTQENLSERLNLYEAMFERNPRDGLVSVGKTYLYILSDRPQDALKSALEASLLVSPRAFASSWPSRSDITSATSLVKHLSKAGMH